MITNFPNGISSFGVPLTGLPLVFGASGVGDYIFVDALNGNDGNNGLSATSPLKTLSTAVSIATSGDTIILSTGSTSHVLTAGIALTASRINFIGADFTGRQQQQGAKVELADPATTAYVLKNTGVRNSFTNIKFINSSTQNTSLTVVQDGGEGTLWENCAFTFGVINNLGSTSAFEFVAGSDTATYLNCTFGEDTLLTTAARSVMSVANINSHEFKSNIFQNCNFIISSSSAGANFIKFAATNSALFTNMFKECVFLASTDSAGGVAITVAVFTGTGTVSGGLYFTNPHAFNVTTFCPATSGGNANVQVSTPARVATPIVGIKPTA